jgi:hypothetical protein
MKKSVTVLLSVVLSSHLYSGFDFGGDNGGCEGGSGEFQQQIDNYGGDFENAITVGTIPRDLEDVYISLTSTEDVDIRLYDINGTKIVHWPYGLLNSAGANSTTYNGVTVSYSGYNGDGSGLGHEYIRISGTTQNDFIMKAFGYKAGYAEVNYEWASKANCESSSPSASGSGDFNQEIVYRDIVTVGDIPPGVNDLYITLKSDEDVDIQLYDKDSGTKIIVWPDGLLNGSSYQATIYQDMKIEWSGYNGDGSGLGHEYIRITGATTRNLTMKAYGYQSGYAEVHYEWGDGNTQDDENSTTTCTPITNDSNFIDNYPSDEVYSSNGTGVNYIASAFNYARSKDTTIHTNLIMPSQNIWDTMSDQEKALYLLNKERYDRGLKPFEGIDSNVVTVAGNYAQLLYDKGTFGHNEDGSPWDRLNRVSIIRNNKDFFTYGENLYVSAGSYYTTDPIAKAIYDWIYADSGSNHGHRNFCLAKGLNDNSGDTGVEGLIGFGVKRGDDYDYYAGWKSTIIVMNAFDPSSSWNHSTTSKVSICQ